MATLVLLAGSFAAQSASAAPTVPKFEHVWIIALENENADVTFGPTSPATYLSMKLPQRGVFVPNYYATGHLSLDNYISMVSGQAPNPQTQADCPFFTDFAPGTPTSDGQVIGSGCVYPASVETIADQLETAGLSWKAYMQDMAASAPAAPSSCRHPAIGAQDDTQSAEVGDQYATRHNPFMYFHSVIDDVASCDANDVDFDQMAIDLTRRKTTAAYNFITPDLCNDGHDEPCINGDPGGLVQADSFLRTTLHSIFKSRAYHHRGLVIVTFDEAEATGGSADTTACCNEQPGPNTPNPGGPSPGPGGGRVGAVMVSPCIRHATTSNADYNHYSMLRSIEDNFGLPHLGFAGQSGLAGFGTDILSRHDCHETIHLNRLFLAARVDRIRDYRFRVRSRYPRCTSGVKIRYGGKHAITNRAGYATIRNANAAAGPVAIATKQRCTSDRVTPPSAIA